VGEKGLGAIEKLPPDYWIPASGSVVPGGTGQVLTSPGQAYPTGGPGYPLFWDEEHGVWGPPGFAPDPSDPTRIFRPDTGQNGIWDEGSGHWVDPQTGQPITYKQ